MTDALLWSLDEAARHLGGVSSRTLPCLTEKTDVPLYGGRPTRDDTVESSAHIHSERSALEARSATGLHGP